MTTATVYEVKVRVWHDTGNPAYSQGNVTDQPCPAILAGTTCGHYQIEYYLTDELPVEQRCCNKSQLQVSASRDCLP